MDFTLTQPRATLAAGIFAVVAASIAYLGMLKNIGEQRKAERRKRRVDQLLEAASEMYTAGNRLLANDYQTEAERLMITHDAQVSFAKLELLGFDKAADRARDVLDVFRRGIKEQRTETDAFTSELGGALVAAMDELKAAVTTTERLK